MVSVRQCHVIKCRSSMLLVFYYNLIRLVLSHFKLFKKINTYVNFTLNSIFRPEVFMKNTLISKLLNSNYVVDIKVNVLVGKDL